MEEEYEKTVLLLVVALVLTLTLAVPALAQSECLTTGCHLVPANAYQRTMFDPTTGECVRNCDPMLLYDQYYGAWYYWNSDGTWYWE